jgi:hypothetical protein
MTSSTKSKPQSRPLSKRAKALLDLINFEIQEYGRSHDYHSIEWYDRTRNTLAETVVRAKWLP